MNSFAPTFVFAASPYCNAAPLVDRLEAVDRRVRLLFDHPAQLARPSGTEAST